MHNIVIATLLTVAPATLSAQEAASRKPFGGKPALIPGWVDAEHFDEGPEGSAFHNVDPIFEPDAKEGPRAVGLAYRKTPVELEEGRGKIMMVAAVKEGEWLNYTVDVQQAGSYDVEVVVAGWKDGKDAGAFRLEFDGLDRTGPMVAPNTKKWFLFKTVTRSGVQLKKGLQTMRFVMTKGNMVINVDGFRFNEVATPAARPTR